MIIEQSNVNFHYYNSNLKSDKKKPKAFTSLLCSIPKIYTQIILEFCEYKDIFLVARTNQKHRQLVTELYPKISAVLRCLNGKLSPIEYFNSKFNSPRQNHVYYQMKMKNGILHVPINDTKPLIFEDDEVFIQKGEKQLFVKDKMTGKSITVLKIRREDQETICCVMRNQKAYMYITQDGKINAYTVDSKSPFLFYKFFDEKLIKGCLINDFLFLLCKDKQNTKSIIRLNLLNKQFSIFPISENDSETIENIFSDQKYLFVLFKYSIACVNIEGKVIWQQPNKHSNEYVEVKIIKKFMYVINYNNFSRTNLANIPEIFNIETGAIKDLQEAQKHSVNDRYYFWNDYILSFNYNHYISMQTFQLWEARTGKFITKLKHRILNINDFHPYPLPYYDGIVFICSSFIEKEVRCFKKYFCCTPSPERLVAHQFYLLSHKSNVKIKSF